MSELRVTFEYKGRKIIMQCSGKDKLRKIIENYAMKTEIDINRAYFLYNGTMINEESQLEKYEITKDKLIHRTFKLTRFHFDINDNPISSAAIFQTNREDLEKNKNSVISYLKKIKTDLLTLTFNGIDVELITTIKVVRNLNNGINDFDYYNKISINKKLELNIPETKIN